MTYAEVLTEPSGRSKGCGIVEFAAAEQAAAAIERLHNTQLNGRPIFVREDRESGAGKKRAFCCLFYRFPPPFLVDLLPRLFLDLLPRLFFGGVGAPLACLRSFDGRLDRMLICPPLSLPPYPSTTTHTTASSGGGGGGGGGHAPVHHGQQVYPHPHAMHMHPHAHAAYVPVPHPGMHGGYTMGMPAPGPGPRMGAPGGRGGQGGGTVSTRVYVGNLSYEVAWQDLKDHMRKVGNVVHADVLEDHEGRSKVCVYNNKG